VYSARDGNFRLRVELGSFVFKLLRNVVAGASLSTQSNSNGESIVSNDTIYAGSAVRIRSIRPSPSPSSLLDTTSASQL